MTIIDSLAYCQKHKGLEIYAYVLIPSHLHMMCRAKEGFELAAAIDNASKENTEYIALNLTRSISLYELL